MATAAASRLRQSSPSRRPTSSPSPTPPAASIARGATARSAAPSPRVSSSLNSNASRRTSLKAAPPSRVANGIGHSESKEALSASLKQETEEKEQLLVKVQDKDQQISTLTAENDGLRGTLATAETRLNELFAEQARSEADLAQRIEITEKLRTQVRELEKEKRDIQRRYNEQTTTFEAERQAFYDNELHLKSRIQSLSQARKQPELSPPTPVADGEGEGPNDVEADENSPEEKVPPEPQQDLNDPETEPAEMTSLKLELSTLSTSYASLQSTLVLLQSQLVDLKRVNNELQEENESYMILLREKTLSGQFDVMKRLGGGSSDEDEGDDQSFQSNGRSTLDRVEEEEEHIPEESFEQQLERSLLPTDEEEPFSRSSRHPSKQGRKRGSSLSPSPSRRGESLADLPITGPGLDLAAELGRAENKDILEGNVMDERDRSGTDTGKGRKSKKSSDRKVSASESDGNVVHNDIDALRTEVKSLKDANKALSLYASKIIDRIIAQEGFEHVLAVDYDAEPATPLSTPLPPNSPTVATKPPRQRPQSVIVGRSTSSPGPSLESSRVASPPRPTRAQSSLNPVTGSSKAQRRSLSFDWKSFSIFNAEKKPDNPSLRPLTLKPGTSTVTGASPVLSARKLDTEEDEEDRRERERLNATMKLMGIQPAIPGPAPSPAVAPSPVAAPSPAAGGNPNRRFSFFGLGRSTSEQSSETASMHSTPSNSDSARQSRVGLGIGGSSDLTEEALEQAEAENSLAALDAHERTLSAELARGSGSGFTEIPRRAGSRRSRRSGDNSDSGSTVWSAGMGRTDEADE